MSQNAYSTLTPREAPAQRGTCHHGTVITSPCPSCEAEGYHRCEFDGCRKLFVPVDHKRIYCTGTCRGKAAHQRERARAAQRGLGEMAREGV